MVTGYQEEVQELHSGANKREKRMPTGKVKWFNNAKGYGFVLPLNDGEEDLFVHYSSIQVDGYKTLKAGQSVDFDIIQGPKGLHAVNIRILPSDHEATQPASPEINTTTPADEEALAD